MQYIFGAGEFYGTPLTDANGNAISNPTPIKLGVMQSMSLDFSADMKELYGQNQFAVDVARGKGKISGKISAAQLHGRAINSLFFSQSMASGTMHAVNTDTTGVAIPATPYQITVTPPSSGTFVEDLGVINASGLPLVRVAATPATGQYTVSAGGQYTFAAADTGLTVLINYRYSYTSTAANNISLSNLLMGATPTIKAMMQTTYQGKRCLVVLNSAIFTKLGLLGTKLDDYSVPEMEFGAFSNGANQIGNIYVSE